MGMYTGLRCKVIIKPKYRCELNLLHDELEYEWTESNIDFLREFGEYSRADFIPKGVLCYMPDDWEDVPLNKDGARDWMNATATDGFERRFDLKTGLWSFQCSLKNYKGTIEYFFDKVMSKIIEKVIHLEYYYEEWDRSVFYDFVDGKIVKSDREGIKYGC